METAFSIDRLSDKELLRRGLTLIMPSPKDAGIVYVVRVGRYCKIGITSNLNKRLNHFRTHCPLEVTLELFVRAPDAAALEAAVHGVLANRHHRGEWFTISAAKAKAAVLKQRDRLWPPPPAHLPQYHAAYKKYVGAPA